MALVVYEIKRWCAVIDALLPSQCPAAATLSDSFDSGCLHMYLESPSSGTSELGEGGHFMTSLIEEELALLEAIPTSPEVAVRKMCV